MVGRGRRLAFLQQTAGYFRSDVFNLVLNAFFQLCWNIFEVECLD